MPEKKASGVKSVTLGDVKAAEGRTGVKSVASSSSSPDVSMDELDEQAKQLDKDIKDFDREAKTASSKELDKRGKEVDRKVKKTG